MWVPISVAVLWSRGSPPLSSVDQLGSAIEASDCLPGHFMFQEHVDLFDMLLVLPVTVMCLCTHGNRFQASIIFFTEALFSWLQNSKTL